MATSPTVTHEVISAYMDCDYDPSDGLLQVSIDDLVLYEVHVTDPTQVRVVLERDFGVIAGVLFSNVVEV